MATGDDQPATPLHRRPVIGVTMGEPAGVGPEVLVKALADPRLRRRARWVIYGMNELLAYAADLAELEVYWHRLQHDTARAAHELVHDVVVLDYDEFSMLGSVVHRPTKEGGRASLRFLDDAIAAARKPIDLGGVDAIVTAPICKESWKLAGCRFPGHTELLQHRTRSKRAVMMFDAPPGTGPLGKRPALRVALATIHLPLMDVRNVFTIGAVYDPIDLGHDACRVLGVEAPRIAVCGLNPHAGEHGQFGDEEQRIIRPAIEMAKQQGIDARGPYPADTAFHRALKGEFDLVVAMYHDQGLIPIKMLAFDEAVNLTLGLPVIRTSVDHGTAFDIVGQNKANPGSMKAAMRLAIRMVDGRASSGATLAAV